MHIDYRRTLRINETKQQPQNGDGTPRLRALTAVYLISSRRSALQRFKKRSGVAVAADLREEIVENCPWHRIFRRWWSQACTRINDRRRLSKILHSSTKSFLTEVHGCPVLDKRLFPPTGCSFPPGLWRYDSTSVDDCLSLSMWIYF